MPADPVILPARSTAMSTIDPTVVPTQSKAPTIVTCFEIGSSSQSVESLCAYTLPGAGGGRSVAVKSNDRSGGEGVSCGAASCAVSDVPAGPPSFIDCAPGFTEAQP